MSVFVNDVDLLDFGFIYQRRSGDLTPAIGRPPSVPVPGAFGERAIGASAAVAPRVLSIPGTLEVAYAGQFVSALRALQFWCSGGSGDPTGLPVTVSFGTQGTTPSVEYTAYLDAATTFDRFDAQETQRYGALTLVFVCLDPLAHDADTTTLPLSTTARAIPIGTARVKPVTVLDGPWNGARTIALSDADAATLGTLTVTVPATTVLSGHTVEIDHARETITHVHGGTRDDHPEWLTGGDFFALDPADALPDSSALVAVPAEMEGDVSGVGGGYGVAPNTAFDAIWSDVFPTDTSGNYTVHDGTLSLVAPGHMRWTVTVSPGNPWFTIPLPPSIIGAQFPYVVIRYSLVTGPGIGDVQYTTSGHGYSSSFARGFTLDPTSAVRTLILDMRQLTAGGRDWATSSPTGLRFSLTSAGTVDVFALAVASAGPTRVVGRAPSRLALGAGTGRVTYARAWR